MERVRAGDQTMTDHHPEETMSVVASELDCPDLPDELVDELLAALARRRRSKAHAQGVKILAPVGAAGLQMLGCVALSDRFANHVG